jgi:hypothetical protein
MPRPPGALVPAVPEGPRVQRSARIVLSVSSGQFDRVFDDVIAVVDRSGGYVAGSDTNAPDGQSARSGQVTFQVPADRFDQVLTEVRHQGTPQTISISGNDVSQQYVDLQARLANEVAQRDAILALMQRATTVNDTIAIQNQLGQVTGAIEQLRGQIAFIDHSTTFATVSVAIREVPAAAQDEWGLQTAFGRAAHNIVATIAFLVVALGTLAPLLVVGLGLAFLGRWSWRRFAPRRPLRPAAGAAIE